MNLKKFSRHSNVVVRYYEMFIPKDGRPIKVQYNEFPVLLSHENNVVIFNQYKKFQLLDIKKSKHQSNNAIGNVDSYVRNWGPGLLDYNGLVAHIYSYQSERIVKRRVHSALQKLIDKEFGAYGLMAATLDDYLSKNK